MRATSIRRLASARCSARATVAAVALASSVGLCGCGLIGRSGRPPEADTARVTRPEPGGGPGDAASSNEVPSPPPPAQTAPGAPSPGAAVRAFAQAYINWSYRDVAARMTMLARASIGQARSEMQLAAVANRADGTLARSGVSNQGTVEAVAPLAGSAQQFAVVTRESTTASRSAAYQGLAPAWHVTLATVTSLQTASGRRWVVSGWQPES